jgi:HSP20 family protein
MPSLTRRDPLEELMSLRSRVDRLLDGFGMDSQESLAKGEWTPPADVVETPAMIFVRVELPGMSQGGIRIEIDADVMTIEGERRLEKKSEEESFQRIERSYGRFVRSFTLPRDIAADRIAATFVDGILEVAIPKAEKERPKQIRIDIE